jgi:HPt (histidine-containing phosphotransfer) domain-containing protein
LEYDLFHVIYKALNKSDVVVPVTTNKNNLLPSSNDTLINLAYLNDFTEGDETRKQKHIRLFLSKTPEYLSALKKNIEMNDFDSLRVTSHSMKPMLQMMGIQRGYELAEYIEQCCLTKSGLDQLPSLVSEIALICQKASEELKSLVDNPK